MKKILLALTTFGILSASSAFAGSNNGIKMKVVEHEVLKLENDTEIRFETHTLKPSMKFEKELTYTNKSNVPYKDIIYEYELPDKYFFIETKDQKDLKISYSKDNVDFDDTFDIEDRYIRLTIERLNANSEKVINFRYMHDLLVK